MLLVLQLSEAEPVNVVTDSQYCFRMAMLCRDCIGGTTPTAVAFCNALSLRMTPVFFMHVNIHLELPGFISEGNKLADAACYMANIGTATAAEHSHQLYHQSALALARLYNLMLPAAKQIVAACSACSANLPMLRSGVNP